MREKQIKKQFIQGVGLLTIVYSAMVAFILFAKRPVHSSAFFWDKNYATYEPMDFLSDPIYLRTNPANLQETKKMLDVNVIIP